MPGLIKRTGILSGFIAVTAAMVVLFVIPSRFFVEGTFGATTVMMVAASLIGEIHWPRAAFRCLTIGLASAAILYLVFYAGNIAISKISFAGVSASSQASIYSLISSPANPLPLQVGVLAFDAVGYESFFRGTLQTRLRRRLGVGAAPVVALVDALIHLATFNLLWVATTFIADLVWGLTYHYGRDLSASLTSHFVWDLAIFVIHPIR